MAKHKLLGEVWVVCISDNTEANNRSLQGEPGREQAAMALGVREQMEAWRRHKAI